MDESHEFRSRDWDDAASFPAGQRYIRYSDRQTGQMSLAINVAFAIAVAILGVAGEQTIGVASSDTAVVKGIEWLAAATIVAAISGLTGGFLVLSRLWDFRQTATIARMEWSIARMEAGREPLRSDQGRAVDSLQAEANKLRKTADALGSWSWRLLAMQYIAILASLTLYAMFVVIGLKH